MTKTIYCMHVHVGTAAHDVPLKGSNYYDKLIVDTFNESILSRVVWELTGLYSCP